MVEPCEGAKWEWSNVGEKMFCSKCGEWAHEHPATVRCSECTERARLLAASEQLLAEKRFKYREQLKRLELSGISAARLLGDYIHQVKTARANLERHMAECTEEK